LVSTKVEQADALLDAAWKMTHPPRQQPAPEPTRPAAATVANKITRRKPAKKTDARK
jgi:hypothetical protein